MKRRVRRTWSARRSVGVGDCVPEVGEEVEGLCSDAGGVIADKSSYIGFLSGRSYARVSK